MQVILKETVESLGKAGDTIRVADGYGKNFLIPRGLAVGASNKNMKALEQEKRQILQKAEKERKRTSALAEQLAGVICTIPRRVGEQDKLFGSVNTKDIEEALHAQGHIIDRKNLLLEEPLKTLGDFPVKVKLSAGVAVEIRVRVVPEQA